MVNIVKLFTLKELDSTFDAVNGEFLSKNWKYDKL